MKLAEQIVKDVCYDKDGIFKGENSIKEAMEQYAEQYIKEAGCCAHSLSLRFGLDKFKATELSRSVLKLYYGQQRIMGQDSL